MVMVQLFFHFQASQAADVDRAIAGIREVQKALQAEQPRRDDTLALGAELLAKVGKGHGSVVMEHGTSVLLFVCSLKLLPVRGKQGSFSEFHKNRCKLE